MIYIGNDAKSSITRQGNTLQCIFTPGYVARDMRAVAIALAIMLCLESLIITHSIFRSISGGNQLLPGKDLALLACSYIVLIITFIALSRFRNTLNNSKFLITFNEKRSVTVCTRKNEYNKISRSCFLNISIAGNPMGSVKTDLNLFALYLINENVVVPLSTSISEADYSEFCVQIQDWSGNAVVQKAEYNQKIGSWGTIDESKISVEIKEP